MPREVTVRRPEGRGGLAVLRALRGPLAALGIVLALFNLFVPSMAMAEADQGVICWGGAPAPAPDGKARTAIDAASCCLCYAVAIAPELPDVAPPDEQPLAARLPGLTIRIAGHDWAGRPRIRAPPLS